MGERGREGEEVGSEGGERERERGGGNEGGRDKCHMIESMVLPLREGANKNRPRSPIQEAEHGRETGHKGKQGAAEHGT